MESSAMMDKFTELITSKDSIVSVETIAGANLLEAHHADINAARTAALEEEREKWLKICLSMQVGSVDERIKNIEESQIVTPELLNKVVRAIRKAAKGAVDG